MLAFYSLTGYHTEAAYVSKVFCTDIRNLQRHLAA